MASVPSRPLRILADLGRHLGDARSAETVVSHTSTALHDLLEPDHLLIVLFGPEGGTTSVAYAHNYLSPRADDPLIAATVERGPLLLDEDTEGTLADLGIALPAPPASWLGTPIETTAGPVGAVSLSSDTPGRYDRDDLLVLQAVVAQCAIALTTAGQIAVLARGKREWERTAATLRLPFCLVDGTGAIRRANEAFADLLDTSLAALLRRPWLAAVPPGWRDPMATALATPDAGAELWVGGQAFRVVAHRVDAAGDEDLWVIVLEEETERRRLRDQLVHSEKLSAIGQLIAGIAHDLNNPLASVVGFAEYLVESGTADLPPRLVEPLTTIHQQAARAANIARSVLVFSRRQETGRRTVQLGPVLAATLDLLNNQLIADGVVVDLRLSDKILPVTGDANRLQQVFVNLLINAAQAIRRSGIGGRIRVTTETEPDRMVITVADDGPGISPETAEWIFKPFFSTRPEGEGTGLGLAICREIVEEHGGTIQLARAGEGGATFRVELPVGTATIRREEDAVGEVAALTILVIDDEEPFRHYLRTVLEAWGHAVTVAADGQEGLALVPSQPFDVIFCDLRMPRMSGRAFLEALQRDHPGAAARVTFCTGDAVDGEHLAFLESVERPYLEKPFTLKELRAALARAVAGTDA